MPLHEQLLREIHDEFPRFAVKRKKGDPLQHAIHVALKVITLGGQSVYLTGYYTVLFGILWVPESWDTLPDPDRYILLRHERVHLRQRARMGDPLMAFVYLVPFFPLFLAYGRARIEWEAYTETLRATAEVYGDDAAEALRPRIVSRFVTAAYGWMWPFPAQVNRWFDAAMAEIRKPSGNAMIKG